MSCSECVVQANERQLTVLAVSSPLSDDRLLIVNDDKRPPTGCAALQD
jgi:hypothetical protein